MSKEMLVTVRPDGSVQIEAVGFTGRECLKATKALEESLGAVAGRKYKPVIIQEAGTCEVSSGEVFGKNRC